MSGDAKDPASLLCSCPGCLEKRASGGTHTISLTLPARLEAVLEAARLRLEVVTGSDLRGDDLLLALIERGAHAVTSATPAEHDQRKLWEVTVAEMASQLGIVDLQAARVASREARDAQEKLAAAALALFRDTEGLRQVATPTRYTKPEEITEAVTKLAGTLTRHPNLAIVLAVGYVDTSEPAGAMRPISAVLN